MADLTKKEILDQLKKLGIHTTSELNLYYKEYKNYSVKYSQAYFSRILQRIRRQQLQQKNVKFLYFLNKQASKQIKG